MAKRLQLFGMTFYLVGKISRSNGFFSGSFRTAEWVTGIINLSHLARLSDCSSLLSASNHHVARRKLLRPKPRHPKRPHVWMGCQWRESNSFALQEVPGVCVCVCTYLFIWAHNICIFGSSCISVSSGLIEGVPSGNLVLTYSITTLDNGLSLGTQGYSGRWVRQKNGSFAHWRGSDRHEETTREWKGSFLTPISGQDTFQTQRCQTNSWKRSYC